MEEAGLYNKIQGAVIPVLGSKWQELCEPVAHIINAINEGSEPVTENTTHLAGARLALSNKYSSRTLTDLGVNIQKVSDILDSKYPEE